jgi:hypothetical protein
VGTPRPGLEKSGHEKWSGGEAGRASHAMASWMGAPSHPGQLGETSAEEQVRGWRTNVMSSATQRKNQANLTYEVMGVDLEEASEAAGLSFGAAKSSLPPRAALLQHARAGRKQQRGRPAHRAAHPAHAGGAGRVVSPVSRRRSRLLLSQSLTVLFYD